MRRMMMESGNSALEACLGTQDGSDEKAQHYGTNTDDQGIARAVNNTGK